MAAQLILSQLPEPVQSLYNTYYAPYQSYLYPIFARTFFLSQSVFFRFLYPTGWAIYSVINRISGGDTSDITLASLFFTVLAGFIALWLMNAVRKRLFSLIYGLITFMFWAFLITLGLFAYYRGIDQAIADVSGLVSMFMSSQQMGQQRGAAKARQKEWEAGRTRRWN